MRPRPPEAKEEQEYEEKRVDEDDEEKDEQYEAWICSFFSLQPMSSSKGHAKKSFQSQKGARG